MSKASKTTASKLAAKYATAYGLVIEVDSETVTVWHGDDRNVSESIAAAIAARLNAPSLTIDSFKAIVWYKRAPKLDLDNVL